MPHETQPSCARSFSGPSTRPPAPRGGSRYHSRRRIGEHQRLPHRWASAALAGAVAINERITLRQARNAACALSVLLLVKGSPPVAMRPASQRELWRALESCRYGRIPCSAQRPSSSCRELYRTQPVYSRPNERGWPARRVSLTLPMKPVHNRCALPRCLPCLDGGDVAWRNSKGMWKCGQRKQVTNGIFSLVRKGKSL